MMLFVLLVAPAVIIKYRVFTSLFLDTRNCELFLFVCCYQVDFIGCGSDKKFKKIFFGA